MIKLIKSLKLELKIILFGVLLTSFCTYMLSPFLALFMSNKGYLPSHIGMVLGASLIFEKGFTFFGGLLGDKYSYKKVLLVGLIIRTIGYMVFAFSNNLLFTIVSTSLVGTGGALITPSIKAIIVAVKDDSEGLLALRKVIFNIGGAAGPIVGSLLYNTSFYIVFLVAAFIHIILFALVFYFVKAFKTYGNNIIVNFKGVVREKRIVYLTVISSFFWILYSQLSLSIPLYLKDFLHMEILTGTIFTINGVIVTVLQFHLLRFFVKRYPLAKVLSFGMLFSAVAFLFIPILPNVGGIYAFIILFTIGEILVVPSIDNIATSIAPSKTNVGGYIGFVSLGWAIGGTIGNVLGGFLYNVVGEINEKVIWYICAFLALLAAALYGNLGVKMNKK